MQLSYILSLRKLAKEVNNINDATIINIFRQFSNLLEDRFSKSVYTTEDSIRYTFYYCLTIYGGIPPSEVIVEYPHPHIAGAEVDIYIPQKDRRPRLVFEFKFDREIPSGKNINKTQRAGKVFSDIFRLARIQLHNKNIQRYFVYVTDREMAIYFKNPSNHLNNFFDLAIGETLRIDKKYIENHPGTFIKSVGKHVVDCRVACLLREELIKRIWVRIYEIRPATFL